MQTYIEHVDIPISNVYDDNYQKHVLWDQTLISADRMGGYNKIFSQQNVKDISNKITELLKGVNPQGRDIIYPDDKIVHVLNQIYSAKIKSNIGDIFSRFQINGLENKRDDARDINTQTINLIYNDIKTTLQMEANNNKLDKFKATVLGDFNELGLRQHSKLYMREKRPDPMLFHMRY